MKAVAMIPARDTLTALPSIAGRTLSQHDARRVTGDVLAPRWRQYGTGKTHAFLIPEGGELSGKVRAMCPGSFRADRLADAGTDRCKLCVKAMAVDARKRGSGLSEPSTEVVATGAQQGAPREAEAVREAEIRVISGDADEANAAIAERLLYGDRGAAVGLARELDARGPAAPVPSADRAPVGQRDHGMLDGVAMVQGANMAPVQPMWRNPVTGEVEPAAAYLGGSLRDRVDRTVVSPPMVGGRYGYLTRDQYEGLTRSQQRKYWAKIKKQNDYAAERRAQAAPRSLVGVASGTGGIGSRSFVDGAACETERLMRQAPR